MALADLLRLAPGSIWFGTVAPGCKVLQPESLARGPVSRAWRQGRSTLPPRAHAYALFLSVYAFSDTAAKAKLTIKHCVQFVIYVALHCADNV